MSRALDDFTGKKGLKLHGAAVRFSEDEWELVKKCADERKMSISGLIRSSVKKTLKEDTDVTRQMLSAITLMNSEIMSLRNEIAIVYKMMDHFIYSYFLTAGKDGEWEFVTKENGFTDRASIAKGEAIRIRTDRIKKMWMDKFLLSDTLKSNVSKMVVDSLNLLEEKSSAVVEDK